MKRNNRAMMAGGLLAMVAVAYWFMSRTQRGILLQAKLRQKFSKRNSDQPFGEGTRDLVDEASWESFPASDPPAYH